MEGDFTFRSGTTAFSADGRGGRAASCAAGGDAGVGGAAGGADDAGTEVTDAGAGATGDDGTDAGDAAAGAEETGAGAGGAGLDAGVDTFSTMLVIEFKSPASTSRGYTLSKISARTNTIPKLRYLIIPFVLVNLLASMLGYTSFPVIRGS
ncbi:hypothetical protein [Paenibacillus foliorum]|nr:hypothetical protein [Paenibacillus foliorum]